MIVVSFSDDTNPWLLNVFYASSFASHPFSHIISAFLIFFLVLSLSLPIGRLVLAHACMMSANR